VLNYKEGEMRDHLQYWVGFHRVQGVGAARITKLLNTFGTLEKAWHASPEQLKTCGLTPAQVEAIVQARADTDLQAELERIADSGFSVLTILDEAYPERLREIHGPPPVLYISGEITEADRYAVAIVGTRRPTNYGRSVTREMAAYLAAQGVTIVSGLARGIDAEAHLAALDAGGRTIAVLGSGLDRVYPPEHRALAERISSSGAVVSDYALGTEPEGRNFPPRNRLISGLALGVIVVEAGNSSGALITADFAAEQGREVFAVPGGIYRVASKGANRLIQSGAHPLVEASEVLEILNLEQVAVLKAAYAELPSDPDEAMILEQLGSEPVHVDDLCAQVQLPSNKVNAALTILELKGLVQRTGGMHFSRLAERRARYKVD
jgi:DNA processing protein